jgi:hypothetical protein
VIGGKIREALAKNDRATAEHLAASVDTPAEPTRRRYIVNDTTVEKLGELLNQNPNGTLAIPG